MQARYEGKIQHLEDIPVPNTTYDSTYANYLYAAWSLCTTLKRLLLTDFYFGESSYDLIFPSRMTI